MGSTPQNPSFLALTAQLSLTLDRSCIQFEMDLTVTGKVVSVHEKLLSFDLDYKNGDIIAVHLCLLFRRKPDSFLPVAGHVLSITNPHYDVDDEGTKVLFVCENTVLNSYPGTKPDLDKCELLKLSNELEFGAGDLLQVQKNYAKLCETFPKQVACDLVVQVARKIAPGGSPENKRNEPCLNRSLRTFSLISVSHKKYADTSGSCADKYENFPYYTRGVHWNNENEFLVGYFYLHETYGLPMLRDLKGDLVCVINGNHRYKLCSFVNKYVLVYNYTFVTEIFNTPGAPGLVSLLLDLGEVVDLELPGHDGTPLRFFLETPQLPEGFKSCLKFKLLTRSTVGLCEAGTPECWLHVWASEKNGKPLEKPSFLRLCCANLSLAALFEIGATYAVHYKTDSLRKVPGGAELPKLKPGSVFFQPDEDVVFVRQPGPKQLEVLTIGQHYSKQGLVNVKGAIKIRSFTNPLPSRFRKVAQVVGFGSPGPKTHCVEFAVPGDNVKTVSLYLNDWQNMLVQRGLVENVHVLAHNVLIQKNYIKSTPLTYIEVLTYQPAARFCSASLFTEGDWGQNYPLSKALKVPVNTIIWNRPEAIQVSSLKLECVCALCKKLSTGCSCKGHKTTTLAIRLVVWDAKGEARVESDSFELLRLILGLGEAQFDELKGSFSQIGAFNFEIGQPQFVVKFQDKREETIELLLHESVALFNGMGVGELDLMCRKLRYETANCKDYPLMGCVRVRNSLVDF